MADGTTLSIRSLEVDEDVEHQTVSSSSPTTAKAKGSSVRSNRNEELFQKRLTELRNFYSQNGHGSIPTPYPPNPSLGIWAANLRRQNVLYDQAQKRGVPFRGIYLSPSRKQQLIDAGFDFTSLTERQFQMRYQELVQFKERFGHCMVPEKWDENIALGAWVSNIRTLYKRRQDEQEDDDGQVDDTQNSSNVRQRKKQRRSRNILLQSHTNPSRRKRQRSPRFSHLDENRIMLLEDLGFRWNTFDWKWFEMLEWAKVYGVVNYQLGGGLLSSSSSLEQKQNKSGSLLHTKQNISSTILFDNYHTFVQNIQDQTYLSSFHPQEEILALLTDERYAQNVFQQSESRSTNEIQYQFQPSDLDYKIPPNDTLHYPLRIWMTNQRSNYNRLDHGNKNNNSTNHDENIALALSSSIPSTMTPQRQQALEDIHFPWSGRFGNRIEEVEYEAEQLAQIEKQRERERRRRQKEREERERVEQLTSSLVASVISPPGGVEGKRDATAAAAVAVEDEGEVDIMALWDAEDDEDDDW